jgi:hypothetical protein
MKNLFTANKYVPVALALATFATVSTAPAFAQSAGTWSSGISTRNVRPFVPAPSIDNNGYNRQTEQNKQIAARQSGRDSFALIPAPYFASDSSDWSTTGRQNTGR